MTAIDERIGELRGCQETLKGAVEILSINLLDHIKTSSERDVENAKLLATIANTTGKLDQAFSGAATKCPNPQIVTSIATLQTESEAHKWWIRAITSLSIMSAISTTVLGFTRCDIAERPVVVQRRDSSTDHKASNLYKFSEPEEESLSMEIGHE